VCVCVCVMRHSGRLVCARVLLRTCLFVCLCTLLRTGLLVWPCVILRASLLVCACVLLHTCLLVCTCVLLRTSLLVCACVLLRSCLLVFARALLRPCLLVGARLRLHNCLLACARALLSAVSLVCIPLGAYGLNTCHLVCACLRRTCLPGVCGRAARLPSCVTACAERARMPIVWVTSSSGRAGLQLTRRLAEWTDGTWPALVGTCHPPGERCSCRWTPREIPPVVRRSEPLILASGPGRSLTVRLPASESRRVMPLNQKYFNHFLKTNKKEKGRKNEKNQNDILQINRIQREYTATTGTHSLHLSHFCHTHMMTRIADPSVVHQLPPLTG